MMTTFDATKEKASESGATLALCGNTEVLIQNSTVNHNTVESKKAKSKTLSPRLERLLRMLLKYPNGLTFTEMLPIGTTWAGNQTKELIDDYGFTLPMERIYFDPTNKSRWCGRFSLSASDRVTALQLLGGAL